MNDINSAMLFDALTQDLSASLIGCASREDALERLMDLPHPSECLTTQDAAMSSMLKSLTKKFIDKDFDRKSASQTAVFKLLRSNSRCTEFEVNETNSALLLEMQTIVREVFPSDTHLPSLADLLAMNSWAIGSGASLGSSQRNQRFEKLFVNDFTATNIHLYVAWWESIRDFENLREAEILRLALKLEPCYVKKSSVVSTVRKDRGVDRSITTEASLNGMCQKAIAEQVILPVLGRVYNFSKSTQPDKNRRMADIGSQTDQSCTIDLTEASDSIALALIMIVFYYRPSFLRLLLLTRSPYFFVEEALLSKASLDVLGISDADLGLMREFKDSMKSPRGFDVSLQMLSTMGNGFTFALMTLLFYILIHATIRIGRRMGFVKETEDQALAQVSVFGDDIIVPNPLYETVLDNLSSLGFTPNESKSFGSGPFRESCGEDYYRGTNVRGVYADVLETDQDFYSLINRLNRWSATHEIPLPRLVKLLSEQVDFKPRLESKRYSDRFVPQDVGDTEGLHVPESLMMDQRQQFSARRPWFRGIIDRITYNRWVPEVNRFYGLLRTTHYLCKNRECADGIDGSRQCPLNIEGKKGLCPLGLKPSFERLSLYELEESWAAELNKPGRLATLVEGSLSSEGAPKGTEPNERPAYRDEKAYTLTWDRISISRKQYFTSRKWELYTRINLGL